jgi:hypothetical protein
MEGSSMRETIKILQAKVSEMLEFRPAAKMMSTEDEDGQILKI